MKKLFTVFVIVATIQIVPVVPVRAAESSCSDSFAASGGRFSDKINSLREVRCNALRTTAMELGVGWRDVRAVVDGDLAPIISGASSDFRTADVAGEAALWHELFVRNFRVAERKRERNARQHALLVGADGIADAHDRYDALVELRKMEAILIGPENVDSSRRIHAVFPTPDDLVECIEKESGEGMLGTRANFCFELNFIKYSDDFDPFNLPEVHGSLMAQVKWLLKYLNAINSRTKDVYTYRGTNNFGDVPVTSCSKLTLSTLLGGDPNTHFGAVPVQFIGVPMPPTGEFSFTDLASAFQKTKDAVSDFGTDVTTGNRKTFLGKLEAFVGSLDRSLAQATSVERNISKNDATARHTAGAAQVGYQPRTHEIISQNEYDRAKDVLKIFEKSADDLKEKIVAKKAANAVVLAQQK